MTDGVAGSVIFNLINPKDVVKFSIDNYLHIFENLEGEAEGF